jgi:methyl-accepting chemotaxis protein
MKFKILIISSFFICYHLHGQIDSTKLESIDKQLNTIEYRQKVQYSQIRNINKKQEKIFDSLRHSNKRLSAKLQKSQGSLIALQGDYRELKTGQQKNHAFIEQKVGKYSKLVIIGLIVILLLSLIMFTLLIIALRRRLNNVTNQIIHLSERNSIEIEGLQYDLKKRITKSSDNLNDSLKKNRKKLQKDIKKKK